MPNKPEWTNRAKQILVSQNTHNGETRRDGEGDQNWGREGGGGEQTLAAKVREAGIRRGRALNRERSAMVRWDLEAVTARTRG